MVGETQSEASARLILISQRPTEALTSAGLASALQTFETALILMAVNRFPHSLVQIASAIEKTIKASLGAGDSYVNFRQLLEEARPRSKRVAKFSDTDTKAFRDLRNQIEHRGFSPKDDRKSIHAILSTGVSVIK